MPVETVQWHKYQERDPAILWFLGVLKVSGPRVDGRVLTQKEVTLLARPHRGVSLGGWAVEALAIGGGLKTVNSGNGPSYRTTSHTQLCALVPCARRDVPASRVTAFGFP